MIDKSCIFCKIVEGEIPSRTIYEDEDFKVILDISPASKGHVVIILKSHERNLFELSDEYASKIMIVAKKVGSALMKVLQCNGLNVLQNNGEEAGQSVFHYHMHLIPRYKEDTVNIKWIPGKLDVEAADALVDAVIEQLK